MKPRKCHKCSTMLVFLYTSKGGLMPVDAATVKPTDRLFAPQRGHVPHWATCQRAGAFKRR